MTNKLRNRTKQNNSVITLIEKNKKCLRKQ